MTPESIGGVIGTIATIVSLLAVLFFVVLSVILEYHWRRHAKGVHLFRIARIFYYGLSTVFLLCMVFALLQLL